MAGTTENNTKVLWGTLDKQQHAAIRSELPGLLAGTLKDLDDRDQSDSAIALHPATILIAATTCWQLH
jgi:hypothetical protein